MQSSLNAIEAGSIAALHKEFLDAGHHSHADRALDLLNKYDTKEFVICFSGHFSAGKSSMINHLLSDNILPQSPIPTSANVVKLSSGEGYARVFFNEENPIEYKEPYDLTVIKDYCKDGDAINRVEISKNTSAIPKNVSILDTPGIDSTNDADRIMTESSLHTVDVLFYVMDYNHVQSEVNLNFLKELQEHGKSVYIVINQMDKHKEEELSLDQFKHSINKMLKEWNISPEGIYYTSVLHENIPFNQFNRLKDELHKLMNSPINIVDKTIRKSIYVLIEQHIEWLNDINLDRKADITNQLDELKSDSIDYNEMQYKKDRVEMLQKLETKSEQDFKKIINSTLDNAYLMPADIREKADAFLESQKKGFKVGILSTRKKVEMEQNKRLDTFFDSLMKAMEASIEWKLKEKITAFAKDYDINQVALLNEIQSLAIPYNKQRLVDLIKPGATMTGEYLLVYSEDIANDIKRLAKQSSVTLSNKIQLAIHENIKMEIETLTRELDFVDQVENLEHALMELDKEINFKKSQLQELISSPLSNSSLLQQSRNLLKHRLSQITFSTGEIRYSKKKQQSISKPNAIQDSNDHIKPTLSKVLAIETIDDALQLIEELPGFKTIEDDLKRKKERLHNKRYTVALFGAFSAGKSSFANALLGEQVLPVSPNPTTAAINKISPSTTEHKHRTIMVKFKSEETVLQDVKNVIDTNIVNISDHLEWLRNISEENIDIDQKQSSFLTAISDGYDVVYSNLGKEVIIPFNEFSDYVSKESLACYVEWMELFYDCPLTKQGITLVDTPGADSINARHTNISFEYIKQADAILFVTYYNHAFSKADRDFLVQLGRVKDAFSLDKMFFIVNAADLAKDEQELELVTSYVSDQLQNFGVNSPKMFPISSHKAIQEKQGKEINSQSGITPFEDRFYRFINQELMEILIRSSYYDIERAKELLKKHLETAKLNFDDKQALQVKYREDKNKIVEAINNANISSYKNEIIQKIEKQTYYVKQRTSIQFNDRFKEFFNPATIRSNGAQAKSELEKCLNNLLESLGFELAQEFRAVSLRLEFFINNKAYEINDYLDYLSKQVETGIALPNIEKTDIETPLFKSAFTELDRTVFDKVLGLFKNTKAFFEKNEKEKMKEELYSSLNKYIDTYVNENDQLLQDHYLHEWNQIVEGLKQKSIKTIETYYEGFNYSLTNLVDVDQFQLTLENLEKLKLN
ncbi:dynamin family protein [Aquibacillus rhizosphaerae]|uniref:Dynamin family protein n=1 Tax=Aquibacillus rhizosphaerae TaxID=3051431 RepID=A0ABT7L142_9BACI|nr:dynamin family protein [Aquibacillus sp. LR5S19]MDL4839561.1 dynamin family protein [Aquibacillus sp. LR5S19]